MKKIKLLLFLFPIVFASCAQEVPYISANQIGLWKASTSDTVYVINFWATWCKPCVQEMPALEQIGKEYRGKNVKVILVSNDFRKQISTKLVPFIREKKIENEVVFMDENNPNAWIDQVDPDWSGSIPATLFIQGSSHFMKFHEGALTYEELKSIIQPLVK